MRKIILVITVLITSLNYGQITTPNDTKKEKYFKVNSKTTNNTYSTIQKGIDMGLGFSTGEGDIILNFDFEVKNNYWIGGQVNVGLAGDIEGEDYTDVIGTNQYSEDIERLATNSWAFGLRIGKEINKKIKIVGVLGMAIEYEAQNRYDNFTILGNNGYYHVRTGNRRNQLFGVINCNVTVKEWFGLEGGFGTRGIEFKGIWKI